MREAFLQKIEKQALVCDGAMGTMLYAKGIPLSRCFDELNLTSPATVKEVHLGYAKAGADVLETNTFGATRLRLEKFGLAGQVREINAAGVRLAREVAGEGLYVAGSVGPLGIRLAPLGPTSLEEARDAFREQVAALVEAGVDLIITETMSDVNEAGEALLAARDVCALPVVVQMTVQDDGRTPAGTPAEDFTRRLDELGADLIGLNCSVGPAAVLETLERMAVVTHRRLSAQPNAGMPRTLHGRNVYLSSPEYMAGYTRRFMQLGARLVGGCCGTTPEHIRAIKAAVRSVTVEPARARVQVTPRSARAMTPAPVEGRSNLAAKLARREFALLVEISPPKGSDPAKEIEGARYLSEHGVDASNIPDGSALTGRMSALTLAAIVQHRVGCEVLLHYSCRDRNVLGIQSDLLGLHALGLRNILATTYEASQFAGSTDHAVAMEVDSIGLVNILNNLNRGLDFGANPLGTQTGFLIGVWLTPGNVNSEEELGRLEHKVQAGANFAVTPPVFDVEQFARFLRRVERFHLPVIAGICPLTSFRHAEFMHNEVPGISVPAAIMERMRRADTGEISRAEGKKIAQETILQIRDLVQGVQIAAPFGRCDLAVEVAGVLDKRAQESSVGSAG